MNRKLFTDIAFVTLTFATLFGFVLAFTTNNVNAAVGACLFYMLILSTFLSVVVNDYIDIRAKQTDDKIEAKFKDLEIKIYNHFVHQQLCDWWSRMSNDEKTELIEEIGLIKKPEGVDIEDIEKAYRHVVQKSIESDKNKS